MVHESVLWCWFPHKTTSFYNGIPDRSLIPEEPRIVLMRIWFVEQKYQVPKFQNEVRGEMCELVHQKGEHQLLSVFTNAAFKNNAEGSTLRLLTAEWVVRIRGDRL